MALRLRNGTDLKGQFDGLDGYKYDGLIILRLRLRLMLHVYYNMYKCV